MPTPVCLTPTCMCMLAVAALFKWQLFKHTEYDAIFFTDVDVDLYPAFGGGEV